MKHHKARCFGGVWGQGSREHTFWVAFWLRSACVLLRFCVLAFSILRSAPLRSALAFWGVLAFWVLRSGPLAFCVCWILRSGLPGVLGLAFWAALRSACVLPLRSGVLRSACVLAFCLAFCLRSRVLLAFCCSACVLAFCLAGAGGGAVTPAPQQSWGSVFKSFVLDFIAWVFRTHAAASHAG